MPTSRRRAGEGRSGGRRRSESRPAWSGRRWRRGHDAGRGRGTPDRAVRQWRPTALHVGEPREPNLQGLHDRVRRGGRGRGAVRPGGAGPPARAISTSSWCNLQGVVSHGSPTGCSAACWPSRTGPGSSTWRKGILDAGAAVRGSSPIRCIAAVVQERTRDRVPRHRGDAPDRQLRLDARAADHGRGDERRHPGARTLERCGVKVEILGFTTRAWKGGQSPREVAVQDSASRINPGRLNDLRHIVYKAADAPWRRARKNLGLMLREGLLKENIDGEALAWAHDPAARPARTAPHPDGDLRRRAGRRLNALGQSRATIWSATCAR